MKRVFYCDNCADLRRWPYQINRTDGSCQFCGALGPGSLTPECVLPKPERIVGQLRLDLGGSSTLLRGSDWPEVCELDACDDPKLQPHHHHQRGNYIKTAESCQCLNIQIPGTRPKEK